MITSKLCSIFSQVKNKETYFGPQGFVIATTASGLETAQHGYGVHPNGSNLTGSKTGDWKNSWIVFARDTELGDPYFVDSNHQQLAVYTAIQIEGLWQTEAVASSLDGFLECLTLLSIHGQQKIAQFVPDETTMVDKIALEQLNARLAKASACPAFWDLFFECYFDWLEDDD